MSEAQRKVLQGKLGYHFVDVALLKQALSHRSIGACNNERLEFLGDSILSFVIADELFRLFPGAREGELSRLRSQLVKGDTLANIARELDLGPYLILGDGEKKSGGATRESILADAVEALLGAIYLEAGLPEARSAILRLLASRIGQLSLSDTKKDSKSKLQELLQSKKLPLPEYEVASVEGEGHAQVFTVTCAVQNSSYKASATASSRKKAEKLAALQMLQHLNYQ
ncbi:ribonuclease III [Simiduia litorea]|uniref:ribonuclease III n=1 Tax=Simiduia litorea TaxID=1435348 RepID=UPI0036F23394